MKNLTLLIAISYTLMSAGLAYGVDYNDTIASGNPIEINSQNNIEQSQLIEKYIINYKSTIKNLENRYEISESSIIKENLAELDSMLDGLKSIQTTLVEKQDASEVIKSVVDGLKIINNNLKPYLKIKQREYENKIDTLRTKYSVPAKKLGSQLTILIQNIATPMRDQDKLTLRQKEILKHLIALEDESNKLQELANRSFDTTNDLKSYLRNILLRVRSQLTNIKKLL